ncbi:uncharacterized protein N7479_005966 [Penicillium vulpinum]|uniref:uncharacterized protein n=1 Tax=Penicillium vulpinum TaxID=29845 RepID=UPI0025481813|nr:uncharacterized protein N7479_005966 [Penicillium vulpinum]KAJ5958816.1 hypothetical protein N7479_005966 [Penicillium vulpinum]
MSRIQMKNTGDGQLQVPAFGDIPIDYELPVVERFAYGAMEIYELDGAPGRAHRLTIPEVMILRVIE